MIVVIGESHPRLNDWPFAQIFLQVLLPETESVALTVDQLKEDVDQAQVTVV